MLASAIADQEHASPPPSDLLLQTHPHHGCCHSAMPSTQDIEFDVCVCGGTLGLMLATTLQRRGFKVRVCVLSRGWPAFTTLQACTPALYEKH